MASGAGTGRRPARFLVLVLWVAALAALPVLFVGLRAAAQQPPEELSNAELLVRVASAADEPPEFGATVTVEQDLIPTQLLDSVTNGGEGSPALASTPQTARVWYGGEDRARAELLGENGDKVFVKNGDEVSIYDGSANTLRTGRVGEGAPADGPEEAVSPAEVNELLAEVGKTSRLDQEGPTSVGGRQAYSLALTPKDAGSTLVGRAEALVDAETYLPLQFLLYADGTEEPVLSYRVSDFEDGPVPAGRFELQTPPGAEVSPLDDGGERPGGALDRVMPGGTPGGERGREVAGPGAAQEAVDFGVRRLQEAPGDRALEGTYLTGSGGVALAYGSGWGTVVLSQQPGDGDATPGAMPNAAPGSGGEMGGLQLPTVDLGGGVEAREFSTPVGTGLVWSENGVSYALAGSVPASDLARAARGLR